MSSCSFSNVIREIAKYRDDPGAPKLQSLIHEFGTGLRDKHNRADLSRTSSTIKWLLDCLISKRLSSECELQLYRVLANFVSDLPNNRTFLLNDYKDCKTFLNGLSIDLISITILIHSWLYIFVSLSTILL